MIVADVYAAGEEPIEGVDRDRLVAGIRARAATATRAARSSAPASSPAIVAGSRSRATSSSASAPATSRSGPMRCRGELAALGDEACCRMIRGDALLARLGDRLKDCAGACTPNADDGRRSPGSASAGRPRCCSSRPTRTISPLSCSALPDDVPLTVVGLGSNLLVRDGGIPGVVIRLVGQGFGEVDGRAAMRHPGRRRVPRREASRARRWRPASAGFPFYPRHSGRHRRRAAHERRRLWRRDERACLVEVRGVDRRGEVRTLSQRRHGLRLPPLRRAGRPDLHRARSSRARRATATQIQAEMDAITAARETVQPIREKTGGSTFKNPPGHNGLEADRRRPAAAA